MKPRILHIITGLNQGGAEHALLRVVKGLKDLDNHVVSLTHEGDLTPQFRDAGIPVTALAMNPAWPRLGPLKRLIREVHPHVVQTWMYHADLLGGLAARMAGYPKIIWNVRNSTLDAHETKARTRWVAKACALTSSWIPKAIVTCSRVAQQVHSDLGYDEGKFIYIPNGIDTNRFQPSPQDRQYIRHHLGISPETPIIGMIARADPQKDFPTFFQAFEQAKRTVPTLHAVLIGPGCQAADFPALPDLHCLGTRQDIPALLNALDVFVLSSAYGEAFPNVIAEAMACGIPCVSTNVGDAAHIIGRTGVIVPPRQPDQLASAISHVLKNPLIGQRQRILDLFDLMPMINAYRQLYITMVT